MSASEPSSAPCPDAAVVKRVSTITAELSSPAVSRAVTDAIHRLTLTQTLATVIQDAVNDLRAHTTTQLAAVGAAATELVHTGDTAKWEKTVNALQLATKHAHDRLANALALARQELDHQSPMAPSND